MGLSSPAGSGLFGQGTLNLMAGSPADTKGKVTARTGADNSVVFVAGASGRLGARCVRYVCTLLLWFGCIVNV
jgi:hypothetical protein